MNETLDNGLDTVLSSVTHTLRVNVENLTLTGAVNLNGIGNSLDNAIIGNDGSNILRGTAGNDVLTGGGGIDNFDFREAPGAANADAITDFVSGTDRIRLDDAFHAGIGALGRFGASDAPLPCGRRRDCRHHGGSPGDLQHCRRQPVLRLRRQRRRRPQLITTAGGTSTPLVATDIFVI